MNLAKLSEDLRLAEADFLRAMEVLLKVSDAQNMMELLAKYFGDQSLRHTDDYATAWEVLRECGARLGELDL